MTGPRPPIPALILLLALAGAPLPAGEDGPLLGLEEFSVAGLGQEEGRLIKNLIESCLASRGTLIRPERGAAEDPPEPEVSPDYTLSFRISQEGDLRTLEMLLVNGRTGETSAYAGTWHSSGEMALKVQSILETAFTRGGPPLSGPENLSEQEIIGSWRGDRGIEMVRFFPQGRGIAIFASGALMELSWRIEDNTLRISQNSPGLPRYYHPAPYEIAEYLAREAAPMRWEFSLRGGGTALRGVWLGTVAERGAAGHPELADTAGESEWSRSPR